MAKKKKNRRKDLRNDANKEQKSGFRSRIGAEAFGVVNLLLIVDLLYRQFLLKQPVSYYVDIFFLWILANLYVVIRGLIAGTGTSKEARAFIFRTAPVIIIVFLVISYIKGELISLSDTLQILLGGLAGILVVASISFLLFNREKK